VYEQAVLRIEGGAVAGDELAVVDPRGNFMGRGFYSPGSAIPVRILVRDRDIPIDVEFFHSRVERALHRRRAFGLPSNETNALRIVNAEGDEIVEIVDLRLALLDTQLRNKDMGLELTEAAKKLLAKKGYDPVLGARPLRRTIQREIEDALSEKILFGELAAGQIVVIDAEPSETASEKDGKFTFRGEAKPAPVPDVVIPADIVSE